MQETRRSSKMVKEYEKLINTAHLSTKRKPGAVFLVSKMHAGRAASAIDYRNKEFEY